MVIEKIGQRIQKQRRQAGLTQADLAQILNMSTNHISAIERGFKAPTLETFVCLANALHCDADTLMADVIDECVRNEHVILSKKYQNLSPENQRKLLCILDNIIDELQLR